MKIFHALCALSIAFIVGCSTPSQRIEEYGPQFNSYTAAEKRLIRTGQIAIGFDEDQVRMAYGAPSHIKADTTSNGTRYIWTYHALEPDYNIFNSARVTVNGGFDAGIWRRPDRSLCGWMGFAQSLATWNTFTRWKQCAPIAKTSITTAKVRLSRCSQSSHVDPSCAPQRRTRQPDRKFFAQDFAPESK